MIITHDDCIYCRPNDVGQCVQASVYPERTALWVLPDDMYGKYVKGTNPLFEHLHGSTWHGDDAKSVLWFLDHRMTLCMLFMAILACTYGFWLLFTWQMRGQRLKDLLSPARTMPLTEDDHGRLVATYEKVL